MSNPVEQFILKSKENPAFIQKIAALKTRKEIVEAAKAEGIELSVEDIDTVNEALREERLKNIPKDTPVGKFISKLIEDKSFAELVMSQTDVEEVLRVSKKSGIDITAEDLSEINKIIGTMSGAAPVQPSYGELSEEDLEQVAGGFLGTSITEIVTSAVTFSIMSAATVSSAAITAATAASVGATLATAIASVAKSIDNVISQVNS
ncbi:nitrogen fixation protein of unknown function [Clostridium homopropionicum DSM 5847]|uniref:Uncharacterized protein n=1 Tax=Clostridium homopropionicum DSM 5847 TaxID=1121318 RepID=A0A0L6ZAR6_9CLOT|nr:Nif11-like leader peptide family RiPP precursor [Clostridium homopropionicum]KOA20069.1 nitrogen fixation protein of unknown function [Clostridium homopropionicum DSM 5847]SFG85805.1 nif11-like leader peptide domain-containing protein [Clostridium homopropionicum]